MATLAEMTYDERLHAKIASLTPQQAVAHGVELIQSGKTTDPQKVLEA